MAMEQKYLQMLTNMNMQDLQTEMQRNQTTLDLLLTVNNSLDEGTDLSEGGGTPADQLRYQIIMFQLKAVNQEINRRHAQGNLS